MLDAAGIAWLFGEAFILRYSYFELGKPLLGVDDIVGYADRIVLTLIGGVGLCVAGGLVLAGREAGRVLGLFLTGVVWFRGVAAVVWYLREWPWPIYATGPQDDWLWLWQVETARWAVMVVLTLLACVLLTRRSSAEWFRQKRLARR